ncbi:MAG: DNA methyltransferase [Staphylococcus saprophyticus]
MTTIDEIIRFGDSYDFYDSWEKPDVIISDGPYGVNGYKGDLNSPTELKKFYEKHIKKWTEKANYGCTLWFWNTEIGWANIHEILIDHGWVYKGTNIWNKTINYIAGNSNSKTLTKFPIVTEVCVQYVYPPKFLVNNKLVEEKYWLRNEWIRSGLTLSKTNEACDVKSAATRKYFTKDNLWYSPPADAFEKLVNYANTYGDENGKPYFSLDGKKALTKKAWIQLHPKFNLQHGITNVWDIPQLSGKERIKINGTNSKSLHSNQKPLILMNRLLCSSSEINDVIWEPFGGLCSATVESLKLKRRPFTAEIDYDMYRHARSRLAQEQLVLF